MGAHAVAPSHSQKFLPASEYQEMRIDRCGLRVRVNCPYRAREYVSSLDMVEMSEVKHWPIDAQK